MSALLLSLSLVAFWAFLGWGLLSALHRRSNLVQNLLLAPVIGLTFCDVCIFTLNNYFLPIGAFAKPLLAGLLLLAFVLVWRFPVPLPRKWAVGQSLFFVCAAVLSGWPMILFGFDWLSYCNNDMVNYVLEAYRNFDYKLMDPPPAGILRDGADPALSYWFMHAASGVRVGSEMVLAWVMGITGILALRVYMPLMIALHLVQISTAAALICSRSRYRIPAFVTMLLCACSPLINLGTMYQLIAQVFGLSTLIACASLLHETFAVYSTRALWRHIALTSVPLSALIVGYPELAPFLGLSMGIFVVLTAVQAPRTLGRVCLICAGALAFAALMTSRRLMMAISFLLNQTNVGLRELDPAVMLFPYFLRPSGIANLFGLFSINALPAEPLASVAILLGGFLLLLGIAASSWLAWRRNMAGIMSSVMLAMGFYLAAIRLDFGLFKLAMYVQPFLLGALCLLWFRWNRWVRL